MTTDHQGSELGHDDTDLNANHSSDVTRTGPCGTESTNVESTAQAAIHLFFSNRANSLPSVVDLTVDDGVTSTRPIIRDTTQANIDDLFQICELAHETPITQQGRQRGTSSGSEAAPPPIEPVGLREYDDTSSKRQRDCKIAADAADAEVGVIATLSDDVLTMNASTVSGDSHSAQHLMQRMRDDTLLRYHCYDDEDNQLTSRLDRAQDDDNSPGEKGGERERAEEENENPSGCTTHPPPATALACR